MCRAGGRRCPSSGGGQVGGGTRATAVNYAGPGATVGAQYGGDVTAGDMTVVTGGGSRRGGMPGSTEGAPSDIPPGANVVTSGTTAVQVGGQPGGGSTPEGDTPPSERERYRSNPGLRALLGIDTPEGAARFDRMVRERESGYDGALDQGGHRPDTSLPGNQAAQAALDDMAARTAARTAAERAAQADIGTAAGRAAVMRSQRANEDAMGPSAAERERNAQIMFGSPGRHTR